MRFFPKNFDFFNLFSDQAQGMLVAVEVLKDLENDGDLKRQARKMKDIERKADSITHEILTTLNQTFITPIEREDITLLASSLDDIIDEMERVMNRMAIYQIEPLPAEVFQYIDIIEKAVLEVYEIIKKLKDPKKRSDLIKHCEIVNLLENQADDLNRHTLGKLLNHEKDPILIIKLKEIYETLENVTDRCEDVANTVEMIVVKNF